MDSAALRDIASAAAAFLSQSVGAGHSYVTQYGRVDTPDSAPVAAARGIEVDGFTPKVITILAVTDLQFNSPLPWTVDVIQLPGVGQTTALVTVRGLFSYQNPGIDFNGNTLPGGSTQREFSLMLVNTTNGLRMNDAFPITGRAYSVYVDVALCDADHSGTVSAHLPGSDFQIMGTGVKLFANSMASTGDFYAGSLQSGVSYQVGFQGYAGSGYNATLLVHQNIPPHEQLQIGGKFTTSFFARANDLGLAPVDPDLSGEYFSFSGSSSVGVPGVGGTSTLILASSGRGTVVPCKSGGLGGSGQPNFGYGAYPTYDLTDPYSGKAQWGVSTVASFPMSVPVFRGGIAIDFKTLAPVVVAGSRSSGSAFISLLGALASLGLIQDQTVP